MENKTLAELHEEIFQFLYQKHEEDANFMFRVRQTNSRGRLDKGYWFIGNDEYLVISFWSGNDLKTGVYSIRLEIDKNSIKQIYTSYTSEVLKNFFKTLASINNLKQKYRKDQPLTSWRKEITLKNNNHLEIINNFINKDKLIIDSFINNALKIENKDLDDLGFIQKEEFEEWIKNIQGYRNFNKDKVEIKSIDYTQYPIELETLKLKNIGSFQSFELDLSKRVICILGENGVGKTTILRALILALIGITSDEKSYLDLENAALQNMLRIKAKNSKEEIEFTEDGKIELTYNHGEPIKNEILFSPDFNIETPTFVNIESSGDEETASFTATNDNFEFTELIIGFAQVRGEQADTRNKFQVPNIVDVLPLLYNETDNRFKDLSKWIIGLYGNANTDNKENDKAILELLFKTVSDITETKIELVGANFKEIEKSILWVKIEKEPPILFYLLSTGYRNIFIWAGTLIKRMSEANKFVADFYEKPAIVIIDEIDTYLHPKWQRNILNVLAKTFVNARFIVTTHSPLVVNHLEVEEKAVFVVKEGGSVEEIKNIYGQDLESTFNKTVKIKDSGRPEKVQNALEELFDLIDKYTDKSMAEAEEKVAELSQIISKDDSDLVQAKTYLELYEQ